MSKEEDRPCTFQTDKRLQYGACVSADGCGAQVGDNTQLVERTSTMPGTGRAWEMPGEVAVEADMSSSELSSFPTSLHR